MTAAALPPALDRVLWAARRARERRGGEGGATVRIGALAPDEARELDALLAATGRRRRVLSGKPLSVPLERIESALQAIGHDPAIVYAALDPRAPVRDRPAERRAEARRREAFWTWFRAHPVIAARPRLRTWAEAARSTGAIRPSDREEIEDALRVVAVLPRAQPCDRGVLSAELFGEAHALDDGERVGRLACALIRIDAGLADGTPARAIWEHAGVLCDTTSSTVLTIGLTPVDDSPLALALRTLRGSHVVLTLGQLQASMLDWQSTGMCYSCENPAVLRAAERRFGPACPPLVCTEGWPSDAARMLLAEMNAAGVTIRHHGDFDLGGIAIMQHLTADVAAEPWRFDVESYERALSACSGPLPTLRRGSASAPEPLERAVADHRSLICEELVIDELLVDLAVADGSQSARGRQSGITRKWRRGRS